MIVSLVHICPINGEVIVFPFRYKDDVILDVSSGRYLTETTGGIHSLEISRYSEQQGSHIFILITEIIIQPVTSIPIKLRSLRC